MSADEPTKDDLLKEAQREDIPGRSTMTKDELEQALEDNDSSESEPSPEEQFRADQQAEAARQNLTADNAVPERRPAAFDQIEEYHQSPTYLKMKEEGTEPSSQPPMELEAYERAGSDSQMKKAEKASRAPSIPVAAHVIIRSKRDETKAFDGKPAAIQRVNRDNIEDHYKATSGVPEAEYADVSSYTVRTRDARNDLVEVLPDELEVVPPHEFFRGGA